MLQQVPLNMLQDSSQNTMIDHLGIEYTELGSDYICAKMPVDQRTKQPYGILHGGASVVLAETLGSIGALLALPPNSNTNVVGLEINANHLKSATKGYVHGRAAPLRIGKTTQVWEIKITNDDNELICASRITMSVIPKK
jgi:1,4-dihydroxy-2-naphthoyl-CoA hydrolase